MKIAFILPSLAQKGPIILTHHIVQQIVSKVETIDIYYFDDIVEMNFPCATYRISMNEKIDFQKYDIIHSHGYRPDKYIWKHGKYIQCKKISTLHSYIYFDLKYTYGFWIAFVFQYVWQFYIRSHNILIVLTNNMKLYYEKKKLLKKSCIEVIHNGIPLPNNSIPIDAEEDCYIKSKIMGYKVVGLACNLIKTKGLDQVIRMLPECTNIFFIIIGDGKEQENLLILAKKLSVENRVLFLGRKNNPMAYFKFFDVFVLPSRSEGFSLAAVEAMAEGLPLVCSNIDQLNHFKSKGISFFELDNIDSLNNAIKTAIKNKTEFGTLCLQEFQKKYTATIMADNYLKLYKKICN
ncbi:MAG: glycosyltransferase family 4 protein [Chitinophagaceae bacterium]